MPGIFPRCRQSRFLLFNIAFVIHWFCQQGIRRDGFVVFIQFGYGQTKRQDAWIPNFQTISEQHDLNTPVASVVTMAYSIDNRFLDSFHRQFRSGWHTGTIAASRSCPILQAAHHHFADGDGADFGGKIAQEIGDKAPRNRCKAFI